MSSQTRDYDDEKKAERVVKGGATSFPRLNPRPPAPDMMKVLRRGLPNFVRGPAIAVLATRLVTYPFYKRIVSWIQSRFGKLSDEVIFMILLQIAHMGTYFTVNAFFISLDVFGWLREYKLPRTPAQIPSNRMIIGTLLEFTASQPIFSIGAVYLYRAMMKLGSPGINSPLPSNSTMMKNYVTAAVLNRFFFYLIHRFVHSKPLYKRIHKKHHNYIGTVSVAAEHAHPLEALTANLFPTLIGCVLTKAHPVVFCTWLSWRLQETLEAHSGYCFAETWLHKIGLTNADSSLFHNSHHVINQGAFGDEITDALFGTMDHWIAEGGFEGNLRKAREARQKEIEKEDAMKYTKI